MSKTKGASSSEKGSWRQKSDKRRTEKKEDGLRMPTTSKHNWWGIGSERGPGGKTAETRGRAVIFRQGGTTVNTQKRGPFLWELGGKR